VFNVVVVAIGIIGARQIIFCRAPRKAELGTHEATVDIMTVRTTISIVSNPSGTPDAIHAAIQAEADVILTALPVGYTSYHLQRK
jgi:hypothetical protein